MTSTTAHPPAGWYADPWRVAQWRWWDGHTWTGYTDQWFPSSAIAAVPSSALVVDETRPIRAGWIALFGAIAGVVLSTVTYLVLHALGASANNPMLALAMEFGLWLPLVGACVVAVHRHGSGSLRDLGLRMRWIDLALGLGFGIAGLIGVGNIARAIKAFGIQPHRESILEPLRRGPLTVVVILFIAVIGAPLVEELFFRGLLMSGLVDRWGVPVGIVAQAVLFGLVHLGPADARGNLGVFVLIAPLGVMLGVLRFGSKRLGPGMCTHAFYNAVVMAIALSR